MTFRNLAVGQTFDWIDDKAIGSNSFFLRCTKTGPRTYRDSQGFDHRVGTINAKVFHVSPDLALA